MSNRTTTNGFWTTNKKGRAPFLWPSSRENRLECNVMYESTTENASSLYRASQWMTIGITCGLVVGSSFRRHPKQDSFHALTWIKFVQQRFYCLAPCLCVDGSLTCVVVVEYNGQVLRICNRFNAITMWKMEHWPDK